MPPCVTVTEPSAYTLTAALIGGGAQSNLQLQTVGIQTLSAKIGGETCDLIEKTLTGICATVLAYCTVVCRVLYGLVGM